MGARALGISPLANEPASPIALVGETIGDVRRVMIEGPSGLLAARSRRAAEVRAVQAADRVAERVGGADVLGGRSRKPARAAAAAAWCDEVAKWRAPERTWDMLQFGLRIGTAPQVVATTTPRPVPLLKQLLADETTV